MDPDANLARQLETASRIIAYESSDPRALVLAELVLALHEWLTRGGFKPKAWEAK